MAGLIPQDLIINLEQSTVLLVDENKMSLDILNSAFIGFGTKERIRSEDIEGAKNLVITKRIDLIVLDCGLADGASFTFMKWLRYEAPDPKCYAPVIMIASHATLAEVSGARDSGAHFVVAKPITAATLLSRIIFIAKEQKPFVKEEPYAGPDRRWHNTGIPSGTSGRRRDDLDEELGDAIDPNMSQDEVSAVIKPTKASL